MTLMNPYRNQTVNADASNAANRSFRLPFRQAKKIETKQAAKQMIATTHVQTGWGLETRPVRTTVTSGNTQPATMERSIALHPDQCGK
jgi:hypothetical protein